METSFCIVRKLLIYTFLIIVLTSTPLIAQTPPSIAGCGIFSSDNIWNTPIENLPVDSNSGAYIATIGAGNHLHPDFGSGLWNGEPIGIPYNLVSGTQPKVNITFDYADESDPGPYPIPPNPLIEGGPQSTGDRHVLVLDYDHCMLYETWSTYPQADGSWHAGSGAIFNLQSNILRPRGWTSADAAGLPILPGLVRYDEVASGEIQHALRFTAPQTKKEFLWPARHYASNLTGPQYPPMGQRFRLKSDYDISQFSTEVQVILRALKKYGMILADNGSPWFISGVPDPRWNNDVLVNELKMVKGSHFEAIDVSSLIADPDSAQIKQAAPSSLNPNPPSSPVRLIFIHHSTGENWLSDDNGELGIALLNNNYYVSDTNYGWGPDSIGDNTDIGHWWLWFRGPNSSTYLDALYGESDQHSSYSRLSNNPGGDNEIIMFKSCFPNSALQGNPNDPIPPINNNPLKGQDSGSSDHTVANAKGIYLDILEYFQTRQDKLFIVITAPPLRDATYSSNARTFNEWLVNSWLAGYSHQNVFVFDFYNVLTTNGGSPNINDLDQETGNHHRWWNNAIQHKIDGDNDGNPNILEYPSGDDHPSQAGNLKATGEFVPLLNIAYHCWKGTGGCPTSGGCSLTCTASVPEEGWVGIPVSFLAETFSINCSGPVTYEWDFGDGPAHSSEQNPNHTYTNPGTYHWTLTVTVNGVTCIQTGDIIISIDSPDISISQNFLDFGNLRVNRVALKSLIVANNGTLDLNITQVEITGVDQNMFSSMFRGSKIIKPSRSFTLRVRFRPTSAGVKTATLRIYSNDPDSPIIEIPLSGTGS